MLELVHHWTDLGMPAASSLRLRVYRNDRPVATRDKQWLVKRKDSQFLWSLQEW